MSNNWREAAVQHLRGAAVETTEEETVVTEEQSTEQTVEAVDTGAVEETAEEQQEPVVESPVKKIELSKLIEEHEDSIKTYLELKNTDFNSMDPAVLMERKLKSDNPEWSDEDIKSELQDKYGIGLDKKVIDPDEMTDEEIAEAEAYNKLIDRGQRLLKKDIKEVRDYFENIKNETKLPELELPTEPSGLTIEELEAQIQEQRNIWVEQINNASKEVTNITRTIEVEDGENGKVALTIDYKLSDLQKKAVAEYLHGYTPHQADAEKYLKEDGTPDLVRFMADKAILNEEILDSMLRSVAKEAMAVAREKVVKNNLLNHDDGINNRPNVSPTTNDLNNAQKQIWGKRNK